MKKFVHRLGVIALTATFLTVCRPASATELLFSFTAAELENVFQQMSGFGAGLCGANGAQVNTFCGVYQMQLTSNLPGAQITNVTSPIPSGNGAWVGEPDSPGSNTVDFYADFTGGGFDPYVTLLTANTGVTGNTFDLLDWNNNSATVTATAPMSSSDTFSFDLTTTAVGVTQDTVPFDLGVELVPITLQGLQNEGDKGEWFTASDVIITPEPSGLWLCLLGMAALILGKDRRWVSRLRRLRG